MANTEQHEQRPAHSPIGASSMERLWHCPGSLALCKTVPEPEPTIYAATGTVAHGLAERWLKSGVRDDAPAIEEIGLTYVEDGFEIEITESMVEAVAVYVEAVWEYIDKHRLFLTDLRVEQGFHLKHIDDEAYGTCDAVMVAPMDRIIIMDYKHGQGHSVEVEDNIQLRYYALGAYYELPPEEQADIINIEVVIAQPRAKHDDGGIRRFIYRVEDLLVFERELTEAIRRVRSGDATLRTGRHCKFCPAKAICPEKKRELERDIDIAFTKIDSEALALPRVSDYSPERLGLMMSNVTRIQEWCAEVVRVCTAVAATGTEVAGYQLATKYGNRKWIDEKLVIERYGDELKEKIYNKKLKSPAQLETLLGKKRKDELADLWHKEVSSQTLSAIDAGKERARTAADMFVPVNQ